MRSHLLVFWILSLGLWKPYTYRKLRPEPGSHHHLSETRKSFGAVQASTSELHISSQVWWLTPVILPFVRLG